MSNIAIKRNKGNVDVIETKMRPLRDTDGHIINDLDLCKEALKRIDNYTKETKKPAPIAPKFIEWLRNGVKFCEAGKGSMVDYKQSNVLKELDYDLIIENTERQNAKLEKQGAFSPKIMKQIKGVSK